MALSYENPGSHPEECMKSLQNHLILSTFRNDERARMSEREQEKLIQENG
jgi:hypothetical protein